MNFRSGTFIGLATLVFCMLAVLPYAFHNPVFIPAGDTVLGLVLGILAGLLVLKLMMLGIKKTVFIARMGSYKQWVDAHNYIGVALLLVSLLHAGFQFDANVHGLTLMLLVIMLMTGLVGTIAYAYFPKMIERLSPWLDPNQAMEKLSAKDSELLVASSKVDTGLNKLMWDLVQDTDYELKNNGLMKALLNLVKENRQSMMLMQELLSHKPNFGAANTSELEHFKLVFNERVALFSRLRKAALMSMVMSGWRWLHKIASRAFFVLLILHVIVVFIY